MQRKIHKLWKKPDNERWKNKLWRLYHIFPSKRMNGNVNGGPVFYNHKMLCINCRKAFKMNKDNGNCMTCGNRLVQIGQRVRVPRKSASNKVWDKFVKEFCNWKYLNRFIPIWNDEE